MNKTKKSITVVRRNPNNTSRVPLSETRPLNRNVQGKTSNKENRNVLKEKRQETARSQKDSAVGKQNTNCITDLLTQNSPLLQEVNTMLTNENIPSEDEMHKLLRDSSPSLYDRYLSRKKLTDPVNQLSPIHRLSSPQRGRLDDHSPVSKQAHKGKENQGILANNTVKQKPGVLTKVLSAGSESDATPTFQATPAIFRKVRPAEKIVSDEMSEEEEYNDTLDIEPDPEDVDEHPDLELSQQTDLSADEELDVSQEEDVEEEQQSTETQTLQKRNLQPRESDLFLGFLPPKSKEASKKNVEHKEDEPHQAKQNRNREKHGNITHYSDSTSKTGQQSDNGHDKQVTSASIRNRKGSSEDRGTAYTSVRTNSKSKEHDNIQMIDNRAEDGRQIPFKVPPLPKNAAAAKTGKRKNAEPPPDFPTKKPPGPPPEPAPQLEARPAPGHSEPEQPIPLNIQQVAPMGRPGKTRYLLNWTPRLRNNKLMIEGDLMDLSKPVPDTYEQRWLTSKIVARVSSRVVSTKSSDYVLEGYLNPVPGEEKIDSPTPMFIIHKFLNGFPEDWQLLLEHWKRVNADGRRNEQSTTILLNSIMAAGNASLMPGMDMNFSTMSALSTLGGNMSHFKNNFKPVANSSVLPPLLEASPNPGKPQSGLSHCDVSRVLPGGQHEGSKATAPGQQIFNVLSPASLHPRVAKLRGNNVSNSRIFTQSTLEENREEAGDTRQLMPPPPQLVQAQHRTQPPASSQQRRARSPNTRVNINSKNYNSVMIADKNSETQRMMTSQLNHTMSIQEFSVLRAKSYTNITFVNKKKNYQCDFCDFLTHLFNDMKQHIKKNHVEGPPDRTQHGATVVESTRARSDESMLSNITVTEASARRAISDSPTQAKKSKRVTKGQTYGNINSQNTTKSILKISSTSKSREREYAGQRCRSDEEGLKSKSKEKTKKVSKNNIGGRDSFGKADSNERTKSAENGKKSQSSDRRDSFGKNKSQERSSSGTEKRSSIGSSKSKERRDSIGNSKSKERRDSIGKGKSKERRDSIGNSKSKERGDSIGNGKSKERRDSIGNSKSKERRDSIGNSKSTERKDSIGKEKSTERGTGNKEEASSSEKKKINETLQAKDTANSYLKDFTVVCNVYHCRSCQGCKFQNKNRAQAHAQTMKHKNSKSKRKADLVDNEGEILLEVQEQGQEMTTVQTAENHGPGKRRKKNINSADLIPEEQLEEDQIETLPKPRGRGRQKQNLAMNDTTQKKRVAKKKKCDTNEDSEEMWNKENISRDVPDSEVPKKVRRKRKLSKKDEEQNIDAQVQRPQLEVVKSPVKAKRHKMKVQNPLKKKKMEEVENDKEYVDLREITANPKTMKARKKNEEIFAKLNQNHEDDVFGGKSGGGGFNLLGNSDESSGSEISIHSARTPIQKYMMVDRDSMADTPPPLTPAVESPLNRFTSKNNDVYVHKKLQENRNVRNQKQNKKSKITMAMTTSALTKTSKQKKIDASCRLIETLNQQKNKKCEDQDSDDNDDDWLDEDEDDCALSKLSTQGSLLHSLMTANIFN